MKKLYTAIVLLLLVACSKKSDLNQQPWPDAGFAKVVHASPYLPSIDIAFDADRLNYNFFNYTDYTNYLSLTTGSNLVKIFRQGAAVPVITKPVTIEKNNYYTLFVTDTGAAADVVVINDGRPAAAGMDSVKLRFANMSPDAGNVDLYIQGQTQPVLTNVGAKNVSDFKSIKAPGNAVFEVKAAGQSQVLCTSQPLNFMDARFYSIMLSGYKSAPATGKLVLSKVAQ